MRTPQLPFVGGLKLFWDRVTFSRLTKIYFIFSVLHCIIQVVFQAQAFVSNADAAEFLNSLVVQGNATDPGFAVYNGNLYMCEEVPNVIDPSSCEVVWQGSSAKSVVDEGYAAKASSNDQTASDASNPSAISVTSSTLSVVSPSTSSPAASTRTSTSATSASTRSSTATTSASFTDSTSSSSSATTTTSTIKAAPSAKVNLADDSDSDDESSDSDSEGSDSESDSEDEDEEETKPLINFLYGRTSVEIPLSQRLLSLNGNVTVNLNGVNGLNEYTLSRKCLYTLNWPIDNVENTKREDIAFIAFQFWLLGMSLVALLNESIPHIVASLLTHILATAWGAFQIYNTEVFHRKFTTLTTQGACGINLLPDYWKDRSNAEIPSMALNAFALLVSIFLSWRLMKTFGWQTFKRVGASRTINRVYNLVLMFSIAIQLSLFFVAASAALWIDQVCNGNIGRLTHQPLAFKAVMIVVLVLLIPWLTTGWISVRKEFRKRMLLFLAVAVLILIGWATMFIAPTFRWTYVTWLFFSLMTSGALLLTIATLVLGTICRINFGKGLSHYLNAQEELDDSQWDFQNREKYDSEKFAFPSPDTTPPTYADTFGSPQETSAPSTRYAPRSMGPRFHSGTTLSTDINPFVTPTETTTNSLRTGSPTNSLRSGSPTNSMLSGSPTSTQKRSASPPLSRQNSRSSQRSGTSINSAGSSRSNTRRWVIE
ncbi:hypothetical protein C8Q80DRAFT_1090727 [Daedaleopsis nitida]|nr:hypothetical protein C8Q80DRAFT_1090727 [Daedaleopsis nitida]